MSIVGRITSIEEASDIYQRIIITSAFSPLDLIMYCLVMSMILITVLTALVVAGVVMLVLSIMAVNIWVLLMSMIIVVMTVVF